MAQPSILEMPSSPGGHSLEINVLCSPMVLDNREYMGSGGENPSAGAASPLITTRASLVMATTLPQLPLPILTHTFTQQPKAPGGVSPPTAAQGGGTTDPSVVLGVTPGFLGALTPTLKVTPAQGATHRSTGGKITQRLFLLAFPPYRLQTSGKHGVAAPLFHISTPKSKFRAAKLDRHAQMGNKARQPMQDQAGLTGAAAQLPPSCSDKAQPRSPVTPQGANPPRLPPRAAFRSQLLPWFLLEPVPRCKQDLKANGCDQSRAAASDTHPKGCCTAGCSYQLPHNHRTQRMGTSVYLKVV